MDRILRLLLLGLVLGALSENSGRSTNQFELNKKQLEAKYQGLDSSQRGISGFAALEENALDSYLNPDSADVLSHQNEKESYFQISFRCSQYKSELFCRGPPLRA